MVRGVHPWLAGPQGFSVTVHGGVVTLSGRPENDRAGRDLIEAVRHIEGVVSVRDELSYGGLPRL